MSVDPSIEIQYDMRTMSFMAYAFWQDRGVFHDHLVKRSYVSFVEDSTASLEAMLLELAEGVGNVHRG